MHLRSVLLSALAAALVAAGCSRVPPEYRDLVKSYFQGLNDLR